MKNAIMALGAALALGALAAPPAAAMTQAELDKECTRIWGPPDHHYTPNGCVKGKLVRAKADADKRVLLMGPLTKAPRQDRTRKDLRPGRAR
ncbi:hypothetical protein [Phenylobacterium sp. J367]|uniref:hypothetical protein n=1 Tax=Phenylobacterium sp. J367 TaxID=2898435 RepID=UPI002150F3B8|nr:hypothetical protein [Phenylobacterium sp. J367]MCR5879648.1 hypothetical protein [Phenylobacterium sp. J367]